MPAQRYRTPVTFRQATTTLDAARQPIPTFSDLMQTGGDVTAVSGRTAVDAGLEDTGAGLVVTVRWNPTVAAITVQDQMTIGGTNYRIVSVEPSFDNSYVRFVGRVDR